MTLYIEYLINGLFNRTLKYYILVQYHTHYIQTWQWPSSIGMFQHD